MAKRIMMKAEYHWTLLDCYIIIWDVSVIGPTVTNKIEDVLSEIKQKTSLLGKIVIYRDSEGIYNRALLDKEANFYGYESPANVNLMAQISKIALDKLKDYL